MINLHYVFLYELSFLYLLSQISQTLFPPNIKQYLTLSLPVLKIQIFPIDNMNRDLNGSYKYNTVLPEAALDQSEGSLKKDNEDRICRICMDAGDGSKQLISPCRCRGSMKHIHEECLKTWLISCLLYTSPSPRDS